MANKGLANYPGENNCFLNSAVQVLWHIDVFRESFNCLSGHRCTRVFGGGACVFCALKVTFTQFSYSSMRTLQPDILRQALAEAYFQEQRFQIGSMDDATECLENILQRLHMHITEDEQDCCCAPHCISHRKFGMGIMEKISCRCGTSTTGQPYSQLVHYVSVESLLEQIRKFKQQNTTGVFRSHMFGHALRMASTELKTCPRGCGTKNNVSRVLLDVPDVLTVGLVWNSSRSKPETLKEFMSCVDHSIKLADLYDSVADPLKAQTPMQLTAVVCYYGKHYSTFCYGDQHWIFYDDAAVKQIGRSWQSVVGCCTRGPLQPLLLIYTCVNPQVVDTRSAMTVTTPLNISAEGRPLRPPRQCVAVSKFKPGHRHAVSGPALSMTEEEQALYSNPVNDAAPQAPVKQIRKLSLEIESTLHLKGKPPPHPRGPPLPPKQAQTLPRTRHEASTSFSGETSTGERGEVTVSASSSLGPADYINRGKVATVMQAQKEALLRQQKTNRGWKAASVTSGDSGYDGSSSYASSVTGNNQDDSPSLTDIPDDESFCSSTTSPCLADDEGFSDYATLSPSVSLSSSMSATLPRPHRVGAPVPIRAVAPGMTRSYTGGGSTWCLTSGPSPCGSLAGSISDVCSDVTPIRKQQAAKSVPDVMGVDNCPRCNAVNALNSDGGTCGNCGHFLGGRNRGPPPVPPPQHVKPTLMTSDGQVVHRHPRRRHHHFRGGPGSFGGLGSGANSFSGSSELQPSLQSCRLCNKTVVASATADFCDKCGQYMARFGQV